MKKFINYFLQGLLYIVPITVTLYVVVWTFQKIDGILPFQFPGLGLIIIISLITIILGTIILGPILGIIGLSIAFVLSNSIEAVIFLLINIKVKQR